MLSNYFYFERPTSYIDYGHEIVPDVESSQCPENHIVCCKSMVPVAGFCMSKYLHDLFFVIRNTLIHFLFHRYS